MCVLVTGGAGYIGSHMVHLLLDQGEEVVVVDDPSTGRRAAVSDAAAFHEGDAGDHSLIEKVLLADGVDAVIHLAGSSVIEESIEKPLDYYRNNCVVTLKLIGAVIRSGVKHFIFASSASVYGAPQISEVTEVVEPSPINPYGRSKLIAEEMVHSAASDSDLRFIAFRYFNVAGSDPQGRAGKSYTAATHLIDRAVQAALDRRPFLEIFGTDYATPDGTCVRDYIHVSDLVGIHANALDYLRAAPEIRPCSSPTRRGSALSSIGRHDSTTWTRSSAPPTRGKSGREHASPSDSIRACRNAARRRSGRGRPRASPIICGRAADRRTDCRTRSPTRAAAGS